MRTEPFYPIVRLICLIPKDEILIKYLKYALKSISFSNSGSVIPQLTIPNISNVKVPIPNSIEEQNKIVSQLEIHEQKIEQAKDKIIKAKEKQKEIMSDIIQVF